MFLYRRMVICHKVEHNLREASKHTRTEFEEHGFVEIKRQRHSWNGFVPVYVLE